MKNLSFVCGFRLASRIFIALSSDCGLFEFRMLEDCLNGSLSTCCCIILRFVFLFFGRYFEWDRQVCYESNTLFLFLQICYEI